METQILFKEVILDLSRLDVLILNMSMYESAYEETRAATREILIKLVEAAKSKNKHSKADVLDFITTHNRTIEGEVYERLVERLDKLYDEIYVGNPEELEEYPEDDFEELEEYPEDDFDESLE